jgi:hypothetical protein
MALKESAVACSECVQSGQSEEGTTESDRCADVQKGAIGEFETGQVLVVVMLPEYGTGDG